MFLLNSIFMIWGGDAPSNLAEQYEAEITEYRKQEESKIGFFSGVQPQVYLDLAEAYNNKIKGLPFNEAVWNEEFFNANLPNAIATKNIDLIFYLAKGYESLGIAEDLNPALNEWKRLRAEYDQILSDAWHVVAERHKMTEESLTSLLDQWWDIRRGQID